MEEWEGRWRSGGGRGVEVEEWRWRGESRKMMVMNIEKS